MKTPKAIYQTVTANLNTDGSPSIIAWRGKTFDTIPLSDGKGGTIKRVVPADALHLAAPDLLAALTWIVERLERGGRAAVSDAISQAQSAIAKATS